MRNIKIFIVVCLFPCCAVAQELNARVTVVHNRVSNNVNRSTFTTLQTALNNLLNTRKWTTDNYGPNEKIDCNFQLNLESTNEPNVYKALLNIQAARPVYNTSYLSPIINFQDENILFKYVEFQQLEFNENRVTGSDALASNLTAIFAYYAYVILAFDYNSFSLKGGVPYFQKAQNVINNAPDGRGISGWKPFEGIRNRYWLVENMLNSRYNVMHDIYYNYYRLGMDKMYEDEKAARAELMNVLNQLNSFNTENPNTMINQFFFQGKSNEWVNIFKNALPQDKIKARELLVKLDLTNANKYNEGLK
ncbi:MAG TPA: DUF4835 family protein [Ferruginibacter sp.]|nr:DUF4835 family protein [Ferruginibacter sp.]HRN79316.1 DUF4835 family protein [Ferruginibacter sp.]HRQ21207.1 DUF4835 family protein [Ferruginibacter sp.]